MRAARGLAWIPAALLAACAGVPPALELPQAAGKLSPVLGLAAARPLPAPAVDPAVAPAISIIIDDLGEQRAAGERALALPGAVAYAFLPLTPLVRSQAQRAHARGHEILLHLPLEPTRHDAGQMPASILRSSGMQDLRQGFARALASVPHARGVNNHQGSLLTQSAPHMDWLMSALRERGNLYFVDSRTTPLSLAYARARAQGVAAARRDIFLDTDPSEAAVRRQWQRLLRHARRHGSALAIGHPYPVTLQLLENELPKLAEAGLRLVPPSELIRLQRREHAAPLHLQLAGRLSALTVASRR